MDASNYKSLYNVEKRGSEIPDYSPAEVNYRNDILNKLQMSYNIRERSHSELNDKTYSEYYLINRQQDMAYNPPKKNPGDSRLVTGITHEKDNTIQQLIVDMNLQPQLEAYDQDDPEMKDWASFLTSLVKKSLKKEGFKKKFADYVRVNISQGNAFILEQRTKKYETRKVPIGNAPSPYLQKFNTITEMTDEYCESVGVPNTAVYLANLLEPELAKQEYVFVVLHMPTTSVAQMFKDFPRWESVPKTPTWTVPANTDGLWGDYWLQQPAKDYTEVIVYMNKPNNECQWFLNGTMMYPIEEKGGKIIGFPLTYFSPSGEYMLTKWNNERIPFFAYAKGIPTKNEVKEETANEFLRIATHKFRYSAFPSLGNNTDKIMPANIWDPSVIIPDVRGEDLSVLNPNGTLTQPDFSFYEMIMNSIDETSISKSLEGSNNQNVTATQYVDQKKENLKKLGITIDGTIEGLRDFFWLRLMNEMFYIDQKKKIYSKDEQKLIEMYDSFLGEDMPNGRPTQFNLVDTLPKLDPYQMFMQEHQNPTKPRQMYIDPKKMKEVWLKIKDRFYMNVVSQPDGQNQSLLGILFNLLTQYQTLRGGVIPNLNWDYMDKLIDENSGFQSNKLFTKVPVNQMAQIMPAMGGNMPGVDGQNVPPGMFTPPSKMPSKPKAPQNSLLANAK